MSPATYSSPRSRVRAARGSASSRNIEDAVLNAIGSIARKGLTVEESRAAFAEMMRREADEASRPLSH
jgi:hypothetical protein